MDTPRRQPPKIIKYSPPSHRALVHEAAFDASADELIGLTLADELLRHLILRLAREPSLARYPRISGRLQRAVDGGLAVDFFLARDVLHLVRLSLAGGEG